MVSKCRVIGRIQPSAEPTSKTKLVPTKQERMNQTTTVSSLVSFRRLAVVTTGSTADGMSVLPTQKGAFHVVGYLTKKLIVPKDLGLWPKIALQRQSRRGRLHVEPAGFMAMTETSSNYDGILRSHI